MLGTVQKLPFSEDYDESKDRNVFNIFYFQLLWAKNQRALNRMGLTEIYPRGNTTTTLSHSHSQDFKYTPFSAGCSKLFHDDTEAELLGRRNRLLQLFV